MKVLDYHIYPPFLEECGNDIRKGKNFALVLVKIEDPKSHGKVRYNFKPLKYYGLDLNKV